VAAMTQADADVPLVSELPLGPHTAEALCVLAGSLGMHAVRIDLEGCTDEDDLFGRIAQALEFPDWFGRNWDALFDCLNDLSWLDAPGVRRGFENTGALADEAPEALQTLRDMLIETAVEWRGQDLPFRAVLAAH